MTDFAAVTASLEAALFRLHPVRSLLQRIRDALETARSRHEARRSYQYLLGHEDALRDVGALADDVRRSLRKLR